jgi:hypothetical protein
MRLLRNLLVVGILVGTAYGYFKAHPESRGGSWGWDWIDGVVDRFSGGDARSGDGPAVEHPSQVFDFEITPQWVTDHWDRVTTGLGDPRLPGYRVALVTGNTPRDLAGALTYYFDTRERLRRISFVGSTGDARHLVEWVTRQFGFRWRDQNGTSATYTAGRFGRYRGYLRIRPLQADAVDAHLRRYDVELVVGR